MLRMLIGKLLYRPLYTVLGLANEFSCGRGERATGWFLRRYDPVLRICSEGSASAGTIAHPASTSLFLTRCGSRTRKALDRPPQRKKPAPPNCIESLAVVLAAVLK